MRGLNTTNEVIQRVRRGLARFDLGMSHARNMQIIANLNWMGFSKLAIGPHNL